MAYKLSVMWLVVVVIFGVCMVQSVEGRREELFYSTSFLDNSYFRNMYRSLRNMASRFIGETGTRTKGTFLQDEEDKFPCDLKNMRSPEVPTSVHKLRPGDIDVIAALGDSLTAASGASSMRFTDMLIENRGLSFSIGGQWNWRNSTTLPNILKEFNPDLMGYSRRDTYTFHNDNQYNMAEIGASSADMPFMAKLLVNRIKQDKRINFKRAWKLVTITIGGNDICTFVCTMNDPESLPAKHKEHLTKALRYFRDNMPRTFVNIVPVPYIKSAIVVDGKPMHCQILHHAECSCWIGNLYKKSKNDNERYHRIQMAIHNAEYEVTVAKEFRNLKEFAAVFQPFPEGLNFATDGIPYDVSLMAYDCFHMSQKGHAWAGVALWNNMLEKTGNKSILWGPAKSHFRCPSQEHPYFYTNDNAFSNESKDTLGNTIEN